MKPLIVLGMLLWLEFSSYAQQSNWQNKDLQRDTVFGISTEKAYIELLRNKKPTKVIAAIVDSGIDTLHEDLRSVLWVNSKEIPGNGIDDDHNGYIDDIHGWNFIGSENSSEDLVNLMRPQKDFYDSLSYEKVPEHYQTRYKAYRKIVKEYYEHVDNAKNFIDDLEQCEKNMDLIIGKIGVYNPFLLDFQRYQPGNEFERELIKVIINRLSLYPDFKTFRFKEIKEVADNLRYHLAHGLYFDEEGETKKNSVSEIYPTDNSNVQNDAIGLVIHSNATPYHGSHISGILAAVRNNGTGINGIADSTQIMMLKVISNIRELRDLNLEAAIRYATDNGAKVINLSFGKPFSYRKKQVDEAVKYAMQHDILIVHAAGNVGDNLDQIEHYPNNIYGDSSGKADAWIEVGASGPKDDSSLAVSFSNYGKETVDVFAPGIQINSCIPGSRYMSSGGTSMSAPVVAGLACLIREYYPKLTAIQVKNIIIASVVRRPALANKCISGGVVNAYNALKLASTY